MPLFKFDLRYDDDPWDPDDTEGTEVESKEQARIDALELAASIAKDQVRKHRLIAVRVRDGSPEPVVTVTLLVDLQPPD